MNFSQSTGRFKASVRPRALWHVGPGATCSRPEWSAGQRRERTTVDSDTATTSTKPLIVFTHKGDRPPTMRPSPTHTTKTPPRTVPRTVNLPSDRMTVDRTPPRRPAAGTPRRIQGWPPRPLQRDQADPRDSRDEPLHTKALITWRRTFTAASWAAERFEPRPACGAERRVPIRIQRTHTSTIMKNISQETLLSQVGSLRTSTRSQR